MIGNSARSGASLWQDILANDDRTRREIGVKLANLPHFQQLGVCAACIDRCMAVAHGAGRVGADRGWRVGEPGGAVRAMPRWLGGGVGAGSAVLAVAFQPALLVPILVTAAALGGLPLLLITTLALVAVYSPDPSRRAVAEKILDRLLTTLRPPEPATRTPQRRKKTGVE